MNLLWSRTEFNELMRQIEHLRGAMFIKLYGFGFGLPDHFVIQYYQSYDEYKADHPASKITEKEFNSYFQTGYACEKILVLESMRIMREFSRISMMEIHVPHFDTYSGILVNRSHIKQVLGYDPLSDTDGRTWKHFVNTVAHDRTIRRRLLAKFGIKSERREFR